MNLYVGIDPGAKGGIVGVNALGQISYMIPMPAIEKLPELLGSIKIKTVCIERSQVYPHDGKASAFTNGQNLGRLEGVMIAMGISFDLIKPKMWQKHMICSPKYHDTKRRALVSANKVFKKTKSFWLPTKRHTVPHDGIIDAALLAEFCRRLNKKGCKT